MVDPAAAADAEFEPGPDPNEPSEADGRA